MTNGATRPHVLVAGGGVAALEFVLALAEHLPGVADVELVTPEAAFTYRPLAIAETFGAGAPYRFELAKLTTRIGARLRPGSIASVDAGRRIAVMSPDEQVPFDVLVVACGARAAEALPGALTFRGERAVAAFRTVLDEVADGTVSSLAFAAPAGTTWPLPLYELALMSAAELRAARPDRPPALARHTRGRAARAVRRRRERRRRSLARRGRCRDPFRVHPNRARGR